MIYEDGILFENHGFLSMGKMPIWNLMFTGR